MSIEDNGRDSGRGPAVNGYDVTIHDLAGSYAVHALTGIELSEFEAHLHDCARCRSDVRGFAEALAELSGELAVAPPPAVRGSVLAAIAGTAQLAPTPSEAGRPRHAAAPTQEENEDSSTSPKLAGVAAEMPAAGPAPETEREVTAESPAGPAAGTVDELSAARERREARRAGRPARGRAWIAVAAAAAVIAVGAGGWAVNLNRQLDRSQHSQVAGQQINQRESALLNASDAKIRTATLSDGTPVSYVVSKKLNAAMLVGASVKSPGIDKVWQLWTVGGSGTPSRDQTFTSGTDLRVFMTGDIDQAAALAVTVEKAGSTPKAPTMTPFAVVKV